MLCQSNRAISASRAKNVRIFALLQFLQAAVVVGWVIAGVFWMAAVYGQFRLPFWPHAAYTAYTTTYRDVFALSVAWMVFACCTGHGGKLVGCFDFL